MKNSRGGSRSAMYRAVQGVLVGGLVCGPMVFGSFLVGTAASAVPKQEVVGVPVLGQMLVGFQNDRASAGDAPGVVVLSIHGVRRVDGGTVVYMSVAVPPDAMDAKGGVGPWRGLQWMGASAGSVLSAGVSVGVFEVALIDPVSGESYGPLPRLRSSGWYAGDVTSYPEIGPGESFVTYMVALPLPDDVRRVDLMAGDLLFRDVPVESGLLTPTSPVDQDLPAIGVGWPEVVDVNEFPAAAESDAAAAMRFTIRSQVQDIKQEVTSSGGPNSSVDLKSDVLFDFDKSAIKPTAMAAIARAAMVLKRSGVTGQLQVVGYTDNVGGDAYNVALSKRRADAVVTAMRPLVGAGITLVAQGRGEADPVASNRTEAGRAKNRRVSIQLPADAVVVAP